jgi:uncharacterized protein YbaP (TraB family)
MTSQVLLVEVDTTDPRMDSEANKCLDGMRLERGTTVPVAVREKVRAQVPELGRELGKDDLDYTTLARMLSSVSVSKSRLKTSGGIDKQVIEFAKHNHVKVRPLETVCGQLEILLKPVPLAEAVVEELLLFLHQDAGTGFVNAAHHAWNVGDWSVFETSYANQLANFPALIEYTRRIVEPRNPTMARRMAACAQRYPKVVAAIGAAHFVGDNSLIEELKRLGFTLSGAPKNYRGSTQYPPLPASTAVVTSVDCPE